MQDTPPATLRLCPCHLNRENVTEIVENLTVDILNVIDESIPVYWRRWGNQDGITSSTTTTTTPTGTEEETRKIKKRFTLTDLLRQVFISEVNTINNRGDIVSSILFDKKEKEDSLELVDKYDVQNAFVEAVLFVRGVGTIFTISLSLFLSFSPSLSLSLSLSLCMCNLVHTHTHTIPTQSGTTHDRAVVSPRV